MIAIDTNVLVYSVDYQEAVKQTVAMELLARLQREGDTILLWQALGEFARWLTTNERNGAITRDEMSGWLKDIRGSFPLVMPTPAVLDRALDLAGRYSLSHWDSMLLAACLEAGIETLYTEDIGAPRKIDALELVNPFQDSTG